MSENQFTYDMLWQAYQKEKRSNELQFIPKSFYEDSIELIKELTESASAEDGVPQKENAAKLLNSTFERRKQKIMIYAAYGRQPPGPLPQREAELYDAAVRLMQESTINKMAEGAKVATLRAVQSIPEILLPSGRRLGPLEEDQALEVSNKDDRAFLLNNNICREA
ncbi:MAG: hypothetical protein M1160_02430 [Candidatus Marsarchaeota archaeon]|nr:hypothetical protein [Candidatus Marsarchaeota archaeon]MCL5111714.1 hypothetical protein [Candidatus Marsarchaeota archaeon]